MCPKKWFEKLSIQTQVEKSQLEVAFINHSKQKAQRQKAPKALVKPRAPSERRAPRVLEALAEFSVEREVLRRPKALW
jgi:hypothetical protein